MLSEISQTKKNKYSMILHSQSNLKKLIVKGLMIVRGSG